MAISTRTIQDSINWAKRMSFNRYPVIGNSLEPALTSANIVMQVILGPPFEWWWNNQDLVFTCNPTPKTATSTVAVISSGVLTVTAPNTFAQGDPIIASAFAGGLTTANGNIFEVLTANSTSFTANTTLADATDTAGVFTGLTTQDYSLNVPLFSHIEHASVLDLNADGTPNKWFQLEVKNNLSLESSANRPEFIGPHIEDGSGNITFRVQSAPDKAYPVEIHVQLAAPQVTSINQTWAPLPDFMQYIYDWGFLSLMWQFADDPRAGWANNQFKAALLGRQEGLSEEQKQIFLNMWESLQAGYTAKMQQGMNARSQ
jgi:hypothetical protein